jgi:MATE family multidrug resistance protein
MTRRPHAVAEIRPLVHLAIPVVAGLVGAVALGLVDTVMLGPLGAAPLAAVSLATSVIIIFYAGLYGLMGPTALLVGQAHGAGDTERIARVVRDGLVVAIAGGGAGSVLMAASLLVVLPHAGQPHEVVGIIGPYWLAMSGVLVPFSLCLVVKQLLESVERPWTAAALMLVPVAINVPLNWLLIYGGLGLPALGLTGAGLASLLAYWAGFAAMLAYLCRAPAMAPYRARLALDARSLRSHLREGAPMATQYVLEGGSVAIAGIMIGWLGAVALAANQIAFSVGGLVYMVPLGLAAAVSIRIAQAVGEERPERLRPIAVAGLAVVSTWMVATTLLLVLGRREIAALFVREEAIVALAAGLFLTFGLMQILDGVQTVSLGALRGMLDNRWPLYVSLLAYWLVALPLAYALGIAVGLGPAGVWGGFGAGLAVAATALTWRFWSKTARRD